MNGFNYIMNEGEESTELGHSGLNTPGYTESDEVATFFLVFLTSQGQAITPPPLSASGYVQGDFPFHVASLGGK